MKIQHKKIGKYQGPVIISTETFPQPIGLKANNHVERAYWLTCEVECGNKIGSVMMADGTGFTIGLDQHIAVYPKQLDKEDFNAKNDQGSAWALLTAIEKANGPVEYLWESFKQKGWYVSLDGKLRWLNSGQHKLQGKTMAHFGGELVHGALIRHAITPTNGVVQKTCERNIADQWATMLYELTSDKNTWNAQHNFGILQLINRIKNRQIHFDLTDSWFTLQDLVYAKEPVYMTLSSSIGDELDLAMCVFHSYTVNAPSIAFRIMTNVFQSYNPKHAGRQRFAKNLLIAIKNQDYGNWKQRWKRTRQAAINTQWWPLWLFDGPSAIMPS